MGGTSLEEIAHQLAHTYTAGKRKESGKPEKDEHMEERRGEGNETPKKVPKQVSHFYPSMELLPASESALILFKGDLASAVGVEEGSPALS